MLVEHALSRFSTDNLSCMIVRFDGQLVQQTVDRKTDPIGVEGDPTSRNGGMSEVDAIVQSQKKKLDESGELLDHVPSIDAADEINQDLGSGPELNPEALEAARKDRNPIVENGPRE